MPFFPPGFIVHKWLADLSFRCRNCTALRHGCCRRGSSIVNRRSSIPYTAAVLQPFEIIALLVLGLVAGALGGMLGIGGSVIMIPVLTVVLRRDLQLSQAVAMIVNVFVSLPALLQHHPAKAVRWDMVGRMLPAAIV